MRISTLVLASYFLIGLVILLFVRIKK
jgi:hypothetical protein